MTRTTICGCLNDTYEKALNNDLEKVWRCYNCGAETPRRTVIRRTNHHRAFDAYLEIRKAWEPLDKALDALVLDGKAKGGAILVHSSVFNWHLKQLMTKDNPSNFDVRYHTEEARKDMEAARTFIRERS
jgi:hypothetical protein